MIEGVRDGIATRKIFTLAQYAIARIRPNAADNLQFCFVKDDGSQIAATSRERCRLASLDGVLNFRAQFFYQEVENVFVFVDVKGCNNGKRAVVDDLNCNGRWLN